MTISIWRYSHLVLAVSSFLFIALASVTGIVLAFEPVSQKIQPYKTENFDRLNVAQLLTAVRQSDMEITDLTIDDHSFVILKGISEDGDNVNAYINAENGKILANVGKKNEFFQWVTNLHRSLFLKETGRFFVGLTSFLLLLIALSGTVLIVQRQRGFKRFFTKIIREDFSQYYHVVLGRLSLIPIIIIALSGTYLSMVKLEWLTLPKVSHKIDYDSIKSEPKKEIADFDVFKNTPLSDVQSIEFPFSEDPEDYFTLKLKDRELVVNQYTGEILSEAKFSNKALLEKLSLDWHTGRINSIWAIILAIACLNILFFIYSGFAMTLKRRSGRLKNKFSAHESSFIIFAGSENGSTFRYANELQRQLLGNGIKAFITEPNNYKLFPKAEHFIIITATYGLGNPPTNATKFLSLIQSKPQKQQVQFSVLGFGSKAYPDFCKFAYEVNNSFLLQDGADPFLEIHTVNDKSPEDFMQWFSLWTQKIGIEATVSAEFLNAKPPKTIKATVIDKTQVAHEDGAFLMKLQLKNAKFTSGDLLAIYPENDYRERQYSIGKLDGNIQLSVKLHPNGLGSNYLYQRKIGDTFETRIIRNPDFHFPKKATTVLMISNGTGIAPFLGMIAQNHSKIKCDLYCGFRGQESYHLYVKQVESELQSGKLSRLQLAYSREGNRLYVKDLLENDSDYVAELLQSGGVIMICGSLAMQQNVTGLLEKICESTGKTLAFYESRKQVLVDCY